MEILIRFDVVLKVDSTKVQRMITFDSASLCKMSDFILLGSYLSNIEHSAALSTSRDQFVLTGTASVASGSRPL